MDPLLHRILAAPRGWGGAPEKAFNAWLVDQIKSYGATVQLVELDQIVVEVPQPEGSGARVMFACHTDTVDSPNVTEVKTLEYDPDFGRVTLAKESTGDCLGADDGAGVWMLLKMIEAKVPGTYVFHRGEERGCVGARQLLENASRWLGEFDLAVEFDRPGDTEIITHQAGQRCASDTFGRALQKALEPKVSLDLSNRGVFTDVRVYRGVIPEVVNIGVGYRGRHSRGEELDVGYLTKLLEAVKSVDWGALPIARDPKAPDPAPRTPTVWSPAPAHAPVSPPQAARARHVEDEWDGVPLEDMRYELALQDEDETAGIIVEMLARIHALKAENTLYRGLLGL